MSRQQTTAKLSGHEVVGGALGGCNRERKCHIPRISPPPALRTKAKVAKGGVYLWNTMVISVPLL